MPEGYVQIPPEEVTPNVRAALDQLADENALLRAAIAEMREQIAELEQLADEDTLTPLPNRRRFLKELERVVAQANRYGTEAAMLNADVQNLKAVNDQYGSFVGDAALIHVANLLSRLVRATDMVARLGGDEFGLLLDHLDHNSAIDTAERLARCVAEAPFETGGASIRLEVSIGTTAIIRGDTLQDVLRRADRNIFEAKVQR